MNEKSEEAVTRMMRRRRKRRRGREEIEEINIGVKDERMHPSFVGWMDASGLMEG